MKIPMLAEIVVTPGPDDKARSKCGTMNLAEMLALPPKPDKKPRAKRGANPKAKLGPKPGAKTLEATISVPGGATPIERNWKVGEYKPSQAMREAIERARAEQPPLMSMASSAVPFKE